MISSPPTPVSPNAPMTTIAIPAPSGILNCKPEVMLAIEIADSVLCKAIKEKKVKIVNNPIIDTDNTATLTRQLTRITHIATKPAFAPSWVVAISSPDPTIEADNIKPGPRCFTVFPSVLGGSMIFDLSRE